MLWYKAWLETRARFLVSFVGLVTIFSCVVFYEEKEAESWSVMSYYNHVLLGNQMLLALLWVLAVTLLMMGGLLREHALGAASFTLALPVSRRRLMNVRIGMGLVQASALAIVPSCAMYVVALTIGKAYSPAQFAFHLVLLLTGGSIFFAIAVLTSSLIEGEYTAPAVSFGIAVLIALGLGSQRLKPFNPLEFMWGSEYLDRQTNLLMGQIPWVNAVIWLSLAAILLLLAVQTICRRDF
jgi:ABC-2 type transport system permease protein